MNGHYRRNIVSLGYGQVKKKLAINYTNTHKKTRSHQMRTSFSFESRQQYYPIDITADKYAIMPLILA